MLPWVKTLPLHCCRITEASLLLPPYTTQRCLYLFPFPLYKWNENGISAHPWDGRWVPGASTTSYLADRGDYFFSCYPSILLCIYKPLSHLISLIVHLHWKPWDKPENALFCYVGICDLWVAGYIMCWFVSTHFQWLAIKWLWLFLLLKTQRPILGSPKRQNVFVPLWLLLTGSNCLLLALFLKSVLLLAVLLAVPVLWNNPVA